MVGPAAARVPWPEYLCGLFHLGGVSRGPLLLGALHFPVLLAGDFRFVTPPLVWAQAGLVAGLAPLFTGAADSLGAGFVSADLLLLSWGLLQGVLGGSTLLHRG